MPEARELTAAECIFCGGQLGERPDLSHSIPKCVGGNLSSRTATCTSCNSYFGREVEPELVRRYRGARTYLACLYQAGLRRTRELVPTPNGSVYLEPGGLPTVAKPRIDERHADGRPRKVITHPDATDAGSKILGGDPANHTLEFERVREEGEYETDFQGYSSLYPQLSVKILLEYMEHWEVKVGFPPVRGRAFRSAARFARYEEGQESWLQILHAYPHRLCVIRDLASELGFPAAHFAHRLLVVCDPEASLVWGGVCLYDADLWVVPLAEGYSGAKLTHLYQRAILNDRQGAPEPNKHATRDAVLVSYERDFWSHRKGTASAPSPESGLQFAALGFAVVQDGQLDSHAIYETALEATARELCEPVLDLHHRVLSHVERNGPPQLLLRDAVYQLRDMAVVGLPRLLDAVEHRLSFFFCHHEGWSAEWACIRADYERRQPEEFWENPYLDQPRLDNPRPDTALAAALRAAYHELFERCEQHIGKPGSVNQRGMAVDLKPLAAS